MIEKWAIIITEFIVQNSDKKGIKFNQLKFNIQVLLNLFLVFITSVIVSIPIHTVKEVLITNLVFFLIRIFSGTSWHFKNDIVCYVFSTLVMTLIPVTTIVFSNNFLLNYISLLIFIILSPQSKRLEERTKWWYVYKLVGITFILENIFIQESNLLTTIYFVQALSLIKIKRRF